MCIRDRWAAADRVIAGVERFVALTTQRKTAEHRPSLACLWCAHLSDCEPGTQFLDDTHDDESDLLS